MQKNISKENNSGNSVSIIFKDLHNQKDCDRYEQPIKWYMNPIFMVKSLSIINKVEI